jgi:hypothetical protein
MHNKHRIHRMTIRYEYVEKLKAEVSERLKSAITNEGLHRTLLYQLIVQGMLRLMERNVTVELRVSHLPLAKTLFS